MTRDTSERPHIARAEADVQRGVDEHRGGQHASNVQGPGAATRTTIVANAR